MAYTTADTCPFCGRALGGLELISAYRAVFSVSYGALNADVAALSREIDQAFGDRAVGSLETLATQNRADLEFWQHYCSLDAAALTAPADLTAAIQRVHMAALALLDRKAQAPLDAVAPGVPFTESIAAYDGVRLAVEAYSAAVRAANITIEATRAATATADVKAAEAVLARLQATKKRHDPKTVAACHTYGRLLAQKMKIDQDKAAVREKLDACSTKIVKPALRQNLYGAQCSCGVPE